MHKSNYFHNNLIIITESMHTIAHCCNTSTHRDSASPAHTQSKHRSKGLCVYILYINALWVIWWSWIAIVWCGMWFVCFDLFCFLSQDGQTALAYAEKEEIKALLRNAKKHLFIRNKPRSSQYSSLRWWYSVFKIASLCACVWVCCNDCVYETGCVNLSDVVLDVHRCSQ